MRNLDESTKNKVVLNRANLNVFKSESNFLHLRLRSPDIRPLFFQPKYLIIKGHMKAPSHATSVCSSYSGAVVLSIEVLRYKPEGRGFDSRWCH